MLLRWPHGRLLGRLGRVPLGRALLPVVVLACVPQIRQVVVVPRDDVVDPAVSVAGTSGTRAQTELATPAGALVHDGAQIGPVRREPLAAVAALPLTRHGARARSRPRSSPRGMPWSRRARRWWGCRGAR